MQDYLSFCHILDSRRGKPMEINPTKQKVVDTASVLFFQKGFDGTSVRDIAEKAGVNVSLISYYFKGKQGLLEYAVTNYYESYLVALENTLQTDESLEKNQKLKQLINAMLAYKTEHFQLTVFINRELTLDSTFVREMTVTYLAKENFLIGELFLEIISRRTKQERGYLFLQLKGMIMSPYMLKHDWNNDLVDAHARKIFVRNYAEIINEWVDFL